MADRSVSRVGRGGWSRRDWAVAAAAGLGVGLVVTGASTGSRARRAAPGQVRPEAAARRAAETLSSGPLVNRWVALAERAVTRDPRDASAFHSLAVAFMRKQR